MARPIKIKTCKSDFLVKRLHKLTMPDDYFEDDPRTRYWVAWDDTKPVAFCGIRPVKYDKNTAFLNCAGVLDTYRGMGIHKRMIKIRINWAKRNDFTTLITYAHIENPASCNALISCGFRLYRPESLWAEYDFNYFQLQIP